MAPKAKPTASSSKATIAEAQGGASSVQDVFRGKDAILAKLHRYWKF